VATVPIIRASAPPRNPQLIHANDAKFVYYVNAAGRIMPAPDTRISVKQSGLNPNEWRRCEAVGAKEIEAISLRLSRQLWEDKKLLTVKQKMREIDTVKMLGVRAQLRAAQSFSKNDVSINQQLLAKTKKAEDDLLNLIISEFDPSKRRSLLEMELRPANNSPFANFGKKHEGIV
jgi:hypothetical protein